MSVESRKSTDIRLSVSQGFAAFLVGALAMTVVQSGSSLPAGNDSYYHVKMASLLPRTGFIQTFPWLHWTLFRDEFVSHHHGFHVLLVPFVHVGERLVGDPLLGGKAASIVAMAVTALLLFRLLRELDVPIPLAWTALLCLLPWQFWMRLAYVRAPIVALPMLLAAVALILRRRPWAVAILAFVFTHVYGGVVLFPLVPLSFVAGNLLTGRVPRAIGACLLMGAVGGVLGLMINPYFPANLHFLYTQLFETGLGAPASAGSEWKSYDGWFLLKMAAPLLALWLGALMLRLRGGRALSGDELALTILNVGFLLLTLKARRFIEYWPVFALLDAASLSRPALAAWTHSPRSLIDDKWQIRRFGAAFLIIVVCACSARTLHSARAAAHPGHDHAALRPAMDYLARHSPPGSLVLTDDWDVFPACFHYNHHNTYAIGLDPVFTQIRFPDLWERYRLITRGRTPASLPGRFADGDARQVRLTDIGERFGAAYVLVARDHARLYRQLAGAPSEFTRVWPTDSTDTAAQPAYAVFQVHRPRCETTSG